MAIKLGTSGTDTIIGTDDSDLIYSDGGDDSIDSGAGDDLIFSGAGDDIVDGGEGNDAIFAGWGDDDITGGSGNNFIDGGRGRDVANFAGDARDYDFSFLGPLTTVTHVATGDTNLLTRVEVLKFANAEFVLDGGNNAPIADDVAAAVHEDGPAVAGNLLAEAGAFDFEGDAITVVGVDGDPAKVGTEIVLASGALLTVHSDGSYSYDPNGQFEDLDTGESAVDTVTFTLSDGTDTIVRTLDITIEGDTDNFAPVAYDVLYVVGEDEAPGTYLFNVADEDPTTLIYTSPGMQVPPFTLQFPNLTTDFLNNLDGSFFVVGGLDLQAIPQDVVVDFSRTYSATDSEGLVSNEATAIIRVIGENDAPARPIGVAFALAAFEDTGVVSVSYGVVDPDSDDSSASLIYTIDPSSGFTIVDNGDGSYSVDSDDGFDHLAEDQSQVVSFNFTATDQHGASTQFTNSNLSIQGVNDDPVAADDVFTAPEDDLFFGDLFADNGAGADSDVDDGDVFTVTEIDGVAVVDGETVVLASGALLTIGADGTFVYDPNGQFDALAANETASDSFVYGVTDMYDGTDTAMVTIEIQGVDEVVIL